MKRNLVIATLAAATLVGGGAYTAVAAVSGDATPSLRTAAEVVGDGDDADDRDSRDDDRAAPAGSVTAAQAIAAALKSAPGVVASAELDDDATHWEVEVLGKDDRTRELRVDVSKATVTAGDDRGAGGGTDDDGTDEDRSERAALRAAGVNAAQATAEALRSHAGATVTSVDFDGDGGWEVELRDADGSETETTVDAGTPGAAGSARTPATTDDDANDANEANEANGDAND
ncbi:PepSY domain-containing protein [Streptomyces roseolilacinus]|uniref:PepSY domain-containing protein n=1 Tax=Streptomyces roseolilacinus TaxID=66904 RepID=UPI003824137E